MANQQEEGWPLGLQPVNERARLARNRDIFGSISFNHLLSVSATCSTDSSSDLDTESAGSFFHDKSITLGSLIGVTNLLKLSRRSLRRTKTRDTREDINNIESNNNSNKPRTWFCLSLCFSNTSNDGDENNVKNVVSLGHFLEVERKAASNQSNTRNQNLNVYGPDEFNQTVSESNSLFIDGRITPPPLPSSPPRSSTDVDMRENRGFECLSLGFQCCFQACLHSDHCD